MVQVCQEGGLGAPEPAHHQGMAPWSSQGAQHRGRHMKTLGAGLGFLHRALFGTQPQALPERVVLWRS
jgi:hypothetical protein